MFFSFLGTSSQNVNFEIVIFFSCLVFMQLLTVPIYKIHVFDEAFFLLTIKMPMITKLFRVINAVRSYHP